MDPDSQTSGSNIYVASAQLPCSLVVVGVGVKPEVELFKGQLPVADNGGIHVDGSLRPCARLFLACSCFVTALFPPVHADSAAVFLCDLQPPLAMAGNLHGILSMSERTSNAHNGSM